MLVMCVEDGLTVGSKVYRRGEVFKLVDVLSQDITDSSEEQVARKQTKIYGKPYYRKATSEEIINAHTKGEVDSDVLDEREKRIVGKAIIAKKVRERAALEILSPEELEKIEEEEKEVETLTEDLEEVKEPTPPKKTKQKTTRRKPLERKAASVVEEVVESEEAEEAGEPETEERIESDE